MRELIQGIKIIDLTNHDQSLAGRLRLSNGVKNADNLPGELQYCSHAKIPNNLWRIPTESELDILSSKKFPMVRGLWISLISLPRSLMDQFGALKECADKDKVDSWLNSENGIKAVAQLQHYSTKLVTSVSELSRHGIGWNLPNQRTVTITGSCLEGLHVDNGEGASLIDRKTANNRLMVNLGEESRYFLFINLPLQTIYEIAFNSKVNQHESSLGTSRIGLLFMERFPNYPVVRLEVKPGEAYIAPTANIIHDGSTEGTKCLDKIFTCVGKFKPA